MNTLEPDFKNYQELLEHYIETQDEKSLYDAEKISKLAIKQNISPEEIINVHIQSLYDLYPNLSDEMRYSMHFLLEVMISYGLAYQEFQVLRDKQMELKSEISVAANMQQALLSTTKPSIDGLDIGAISVPSNQMNGDYYHFMKDANGSLGVAIADVIGKGIPAALCMSMIKYSVDSFPENRMSSNTILESLNRVVERNVEPGMFITMFYGHYEPKTEKFLYSTAGHEPGFIYHAKEQKFEEIEAKGLVLGVAKDAVYKQYERKINKGDMIILLTDGVTECRQGDRFIEREEVLDVIKQYAHLSGQQIVENVFKYFERLQNFQMRDDFTLIILKKDV